MTNPFELIDKRLFIIEGLLLDIKHGTKTEPKEVAEQFLTIKEASKMLNISVPTIYSKVSKRELPHMKRGKRLYFSQTELTDYLKKGKVMSSDEIDKKAEQYLDKS